MRTSFFSLLVLLAVAGQMPACRAEPATPAKPAAPATPKEPGKSEGGPRAAATEASHIDALSPDEVRRLERARAKAAAKTKSTPSARASTPRGPIADSKAPVAPKDAAAKEPVSPKDAGRPKEATAPKDAAVAPSTEPKSAASTRAERATRSHRARRSVRARPPRDTADLDRRSVRERTYGGRSYGETRERRPRVGDIVPPGVPLYPLPPRPFPPPGLASRRVYPPFPGVRDEAEDDIDDDDMPTRGRMRPSPF